VTRHSYDPFWAQNQLVFHAYDYGANIQIKVSERLQSLEKETRLRPDDHANDSSDDSVSESNSSEEGSRNSVRSESTPFQTQRREDDWPLDLDPSPNGPDSLYSDGRGNC
jgi:hypothetical protein